MQTDQKWAGRLVAWFRRHQRQMPWRENRSPYRVWVSEIMLQQTQVVTATPYFTRFIQRFPTLSALATADQQAVLQLWEGLGYYSRARNLHRAAQLCVAQHDGTLPTTAVALRTLPGIGEYTAAAIASICHGEAVPVVDGNVLRVFTRFWAIADDIGRPATRQHVAARLAPVIATTDPAAFNEAMMEIGALICRPRAADCPNCPLAPDCLAHANGTELTFPVKRRRPAIPHITVAVGLVAAADGTLLLRQRRDDQMLGGLWEFPGGRRQGNEAMRLTVAREIERETGVQVIVDAKLGSVKHAFSHFRITLHAFLCHPTAGTASARRGGSVRWVGAASLDQFPMGAATRRIAALHQSEKKHATRKT
jgi:A/G-specific adenine glycosylase